MSIPLVPTRGLGDGGGGDVVSSSYITYNITFSTDYGCEKTVVVEV